MQFQSAIRRRIWLSAFACTALDAALAAVVAQYFFPQFWIPFIAIFGFLLLWPVIYGIRGAIYAYFLGFVERQSAIEGLKGEFRTNRLPADWGTFWDADDYFNAVVQSNEVADAARIYAAGMIGGLATVRLYSSVDTMKAYSRIEQALKEFSDAGPDSP